MGRTQFTFYESFFKAISSVRKKNEKADLYDALCAYALYGTEPNLTGSAAGMFELIRPNLDASRRKAMGGKAGRERKDSGKIPGREREDTGKMPGTSGEDSSNKKKGEIEIEKETKKENELENECYPPTPFPPEPERGAEERQKVSAVVSDYLNRINPAASRTCLEELACFARELGPEVCRRAFDIAIDGKKATWPYIRAILRDKQSRGIKCLADWEAAENTRGAQSTQQDQSLPSDDISREFAAFHANRNGGSP